MGSRHSQRKNCSKIQAALDTFVSKDISKMAGDFTLSDIKA